jgi:predicted membrane protein
LLAKLSDPFWALAAAQAAPDARGRPVRCSYIWECIPRINSFVGDVDLVVPPDMALSIRANGFVTDVRFKGHRYGGFLVPVNVASENYNEASRRVRVDLACFVGDMKVRDA